MSEEVIAALISVSGVIFTAIITLYVAYFRSYSNNVTKERAKWLQCFREEINVLFKGIDASRLSSVGGEHEQKAIVDAYGARAAIYSRLRSYPRCGNEYNKEVKDILSKLKFNTDDKDNTDIDTLRSYLNKILEREWDKAKEESYMFSKRSGASFFILIFALIWITWGITFIFLLANKAIECDYPITLCVLIPWAIITLMILILPLISYILIERRNIINSYLERQLDKIADSKIKETNTTIEVKYTGFFKSKVTIKVDKTK